METTIDAAEQLRAGVARIDITRRSPDAADDPLYANIDAALVNDPLYVKALVLQTDTTAAVIISVDAVAVAEIGSIGNDYVASVRQQLQQQLAIPERHILFNASHCHGVVCTDVAARTVAAVTRAWENLVPVRMGTGAGHEERIMENRRLRLRSGAEADVRHAYSLPADEDVAAVGPVDPQIGILRLDRLDGRPLAVVYNFACHPIQGVPSGANTADISGFASRLIEDSLGSGVIALFLQGCAGDINPVSYKDVDHPRDAEPLGNMLGLSTVRAWHETAVTTASALQVRTTMVPLPRAQLTPAINALEQSQRQLLASLRGTTLELKSFLALTVKYRLSSDFPSGHAHQYLHQQRMGWKDLEKLDADNRENLDVYLGNIHIMEQLTRIQANLDLLRMHQAHNVEAQWKPIEAEVTGLRVGDFVLLTFPGELSVEIGLGIKQRSPHPWTFVAGVTNGYIYYAPTARQLENRGGAQEDSDCLLAPEWQARFETAALEILEKL